MKATTSRTSNKIEQHGIRSFCIYVSTDPMAVLANVLIQPAMNRIDLLAEAFWRDRHPDTNGKVVLCQMLLRS